jgi:hypothetical protein
VPKSVLENEDSVISFVICLQADGWCQDQAQVYQTRSWPYRGKRST